MDFKIFATIFTTVFFAELGDKTQLATMLFASDQVVSKWTVFFASAAALIVAAGLGVVAGSTISNYVSKSTLSYVAGTAFIGIGILTIWKA